MRYWGKNQGKEPPGLCKHGKNVEPYSMVGCQHCDQSMNKTILERFATVYAETNGNVYITAKVLGIGYKTAKKYRDVLKGEK